MADPYVLRRVRVAHVLILGELWEPGRTASLQKSLKDADLQEIGEFVRENVSRWLRLNAGDFSRVIDFSAVCGDTEIPWSSEENELAYLDTVSEF